MSPRKRTVLSVLLGVAASAAALHALSCSVSAAGLDGGPEPPRAVDGATLPDAGPEVFEPPAPTFARGAVVLIHGHDTLPAFRLCPAASARATVSDGTMAPIPTARMPGASLAGLDARGAVRLDAPPEFDGRDFVLLLLDEDTKKNESLVSGACSSLACDGDSGTGCLPATKRVALRLPDPGLLTKPGAVLAVRGTSNTDVQIDVRVALSNGLRSGHLNLQLVNVSDYAGPVTYEVSEPLDDGGLATRSTTLSSMSLTPVFRTSYGDRLKAGAHEESLVEIHEQSDPTVPIVAHFAAGGPYALVLVGAQANASKPLKFIALPLL